MTNKKSKSVVQPSDELAEIDEQLNAALEQLDVTNTKVTEILNTVDVTPSAAASITADDEPETPEPPSNTPPVPQSPVQRKSVSGI
jgi:hypothetical protein